VIRCDNLAVAFAARRRPALDNPTPATEEHTAVPLQHQIGRSLAHLWPRRCLCPPPVFRQQQPPVLPPVARLQRTAKGCSCCRCIRHVLSSARAWPCHVHTHLRTPNNRVRTSPLSLSLKLPFPRPALYKVAGDRRYSPGC
jgi:hypothetical protein